MWVDRRSGRLVLREPGAHFIENSLLSQLTDGMCGCMLCLVCERVCEGVCCVFVCVYACMCMWVMSQERARMWECEKIHAYALTHTITVPSARAHTRTQTHMHTDINTDSSRLLHAVAVLRQEILVRCVATAARGPIPTHPCTQPTTRTHTQSHTL